MKWMIKSAEDDILYDGGDGAVLSVVVMAPDRWSAINLVHEFAVPSFVSLTAEEDG